MHYSGSCLAHVFFWGPGMQASKRFQGEATQGELYQWCQCQPESPENLKPHLFYNVICSNARENRRPSHHPNVRKAWFDIPLGVGSPLGEANLPWFGWMPLKPPICLDSGCMTQRTFFIWSMGGGAFGVPYLDLIKQQGRSVSTASQGALKHMGIRMDSDVHTWQWEKLCEFYGAAALIFFTSLDYCHGLLMVPPQSVLNTAAKVLLFSYIMSLLCSEPSKGFMPHSE